MSNYTHHQCHTTQTCNLSQQLTVRLCWRSLCYYHKENRLWPVFLWICALHQLQRHSWESSTSWETHPLVVPIRLLWRGCHNIIYIFLTYSMAHFSYHYRGYYHYSPGVLHVRVFRPDTMWRNVAANFRPEFRVSLYHECCHKRWWRTLSIISVGMARNFRNVLGPSFLSSTMSWL